MDPPASHPAVAGQVCDRCRLKKIKCDGILPSCSSCLAAGTPCVVSAKLRRKTKIRGFQASAEDHVKRLQAENDELRRTLQAERETNASLHRRLEELSTTTVGTPSSRNELLHTTTAVGQLRPVSTHSHDTGSSKSALIITHMGRLVLDSIGGERFAGSTSGVHFVLSVQKTLQNRHIRQHPFPESCFRLHLLEPCSSSAELLDLTNIDPGLPCAFIENFQHYFPMPVSFYTQQINGFVDAWGALCPVLAPSDLSKSISRLSSSTSPDLSGVSDDALLALFQVCVVLLINPISDTAGRADSFTSTYWAFIRIMAPRLISKGDLPSLQALIIFSFYLQITGQILLMAQMNGILVRLAQSLGLHRHSRRFKFIEGQVEMRRRMWWWIYLYDKSTSVAHGLPKLISDIDVDVDYPLDCELTETNTSRLAFPLPGEVTQVSDFIAYVHLGRILSETLTDLYTTTRRRKGAEKIAKLHNDLQAWDQRFGNFLGSQNASHTDSQSTIRLWLSLMAQYTLVLIYRPALTFDDTTPQFAKSLDICAGACSAILNLLSSHDNRTAIRGIIPCGPSLIFQCGLMQVFYRCHTISQDDSSRKIAPSCSEELVEHAINLLANYAPNLSPSLYGQQGLSEPLSTAQNEAKDLLQSLYLDLKRIGGPISPSPVTTSDSSQSLPSSFTPSQSLFQNTETASFDLLGGFGSLDSLNHLESLDWILDGSPADATLTWE